jgi:hypothetical protein
MAYENITFNGVNLNVRSLTPVRRQKTVKQVIGKSLSELKVLGVGGFQWEIQLQGQILGTTAADVAVNRTAVEALYDAEPHAFVDGIHNGTYYVRPGTLQFNDNESDVNLTYNYSMALVQQ